MKFIFPKNYTFNNKLFGLIDYSTAIINVVFYFFVFAITNLLFNDINLKIFIFIVLCFPLFIFSLVGINGENILFVFIYFFKFLSKRNVYLFQKNKIL